MILINIILFFLGIISYILYKKYSYNKKIKYVHIKNCIENKKFTKGSDSVFREQLDRNYLFFGEEGMNLIKNSSVAIINCETIGSSIAVTLARSGIKKLILIDNNKLSIDNYKYHPFAKCEDINKYNLDILNNYLRQINPNIELILIKEDINFDNLLIYFNKQDVPDYIVDCINEKNIIQKCKLLKYSIDNNIKFISTFSPLIYQNDPTQIRHSPFSSVENAQISSLIYNNYKKLYNCNVPEFNIVYSKQQKINENSKKIKENLFSYGVISDSASSIILCDLSKFKFKENEEEKGINEIKIAGKYLPECIEDYKKYEMENGTEEKILSNLTYDDFKLICKAFKNASCLKQKPTPKMRFFRWRLFKEPARDNIVIMGKSEINKHMNIHNEDELINFYGKSVVDRIDGKLNFVFNKKE